MADKPKFQWEAEFNMSMLEFERLNAIFKKADDSAFLLQNGDIRSAIPCFSALRLIKIYISGKIHKNVKNHIQEKENNLKDTMKKLTIHLDKGLINKSLERQAISELMEFYGLLFWAKDMVGYGVPFRKRFDQETTMKRALGMK